MTDATAGALLDAAEAEFAADGVEHASLRAIMRRAGANPAAVHYHFGSREALAQAVLDRVLEPLQRRRLELLDGLVADGGVVDLDSLVDALIGPDLERAAELASRHERGHRLVGAIYVTPATFVTRLVERSFAPVAARFLPHLQRAVPHVSTVELAWRVRWCLFGAVGARLCDDDLTAASIDVERRRLVRALAAALAAPTTEDQT